MDSVRKSPRPFPSTVTLLLSSGDRSAKNYRVVEGRNEICKTADGYLAIKSSKYSLPLNEYGKQADVLACIDASEISFKAQTHLQLELEAVSDYISVHRDQVAAVFLEPGKQSPKVCCLGEKDTIQFTSSNASVVVAISPEEVQVGSSVPPEVHVLGEESNPPRPVGKPGIESIAPFRGTPGASVSFDMVTETPTAKRVEENSIAEPHSSYRTPPYSSARDRITQEVQSPTKVMAMRPNDGERRDEPIAESDSSVIHDAIAPKDDKNLPSPLIQSLNRAESASARVENPEAAKPSNINSFTGEDDGDTTESEAGDDANTPQNNEDLIRQSGVSSISGSPPVAARSRKRPPESRGTPQPRVAKKARSESATPLIDSSEEVLVDDETPKPTKRGRPKKSLSEKTKSPNPQQVTPTVVVETRRRKDSTPVSTVQSPTSADGSNGLSALGGKKPSVVFSSSGFQELPQMLKNFKAIATVSTSVTSKTDFLCIGKGGVKKTPKLLYAVALGKPVLSDDWARESAKAKKLLDPNDYLAHDADHEEEWKLSEDWAAGRARTGLFNDYAVYITQALKKDYGAGYKDIEDLAKTLGAKGVSSGSARGAGDADDTIVLGLQHGDPDSVALHNQGRTCYDKDFLPMAILRGELCFEEFKIVPAETPAKKGGKRKSGV